MRVSQYFLPTLRDVPTDAQIPSHQLLLRGGFLRTVGAGVYNFLPLGWRVLQKIEGVLRKTMDEIDVHELHMPTLVPRELMEETGRWNLDVVYKLKDRREAEWALGFTHEEVITDMARGDLRSWRDLPVILYQIQTKFRDEPRARGGLLRTREFTMYDAYSFDRDEAAMAVSYHKVREAYDRYFQRIGLPALSVEADGGAIGDLENHEFMTLTEAGEDTVLLCEATGYAANAEKCPLLPPVASEESVSAELSEVSTPGQKTIAEVAAFLKLPATQTAKALVYVGDETPVMFLLRGDRTLNEIKAQKLLGAKTFRMASDSEIEKVTGAPVGYLGPVGLSNLRVIADQELSVLKNLVVGANKLDTHFVGAEPGRDFTPEYADIRIAEEGDLSPDGGGVLKTARGIEVGHIFMLGDKYSKAMGATFTDSDSQLKPIQMGCYGIGLTRTMSALIEANHDKDGIVWPITVAPYEVVVVVAGFQDPAQIAAGEELYAALRAKGIEVALDDRDERPGVKFKDADLVGYPVRVVIGKGLANGVVETKLRRDPGSLQQVPVADAAEVVAALVASLKAELA